MKTIRANLFLLILMMLVLPNCKDKEAVTTDRLDSSKTNNTDKYDPSKLNIDIGQSTTVSVAGLVLDEKGNPISGAEVILFSDVTMTDDDGKFVFFEKGAYSNHAYVKVIKEGYLVGSRAFIPIPGMNNVVIKMLSAKTVGSFDSNAGGDAFFKGVSIKFKSGFITSSGSKYNGKVTVKARYLDPTAEDIGEIMPGSLRGASLDGETYLKTYGMIGVELVDDAGNELQIGDGNFADLQMPIPAEMMMGAPANIPLWHFDEEEGYWKEEGSAIKDGNKYIARVSHFSFWNWDIPIESIWTHGQLITSNGTALSGLKIVLTSANDGSRSCISGSKGNFGGRIPANQDIILQVFEKGKMILTRTFSSLSSDNPIGDVICKSESFIEIFGKAESCNGSAFSGLLKIDNKNYVSVENGEFSFVKSRNESFSISLVNGQGVPLGKIYDYNSGTRDMDIGILKYCPENQGVWIQEFMEVGVSKYTIGEDLNALAEYNLTNANVYENMESGNFYFKAAIEVEGETIDTFRIEIPQGYRSRWVYQSNVGENKVEFYTGTESRIVKNKNLRIDLSKFTVEKDKASEIKVGGTYDVSNESGDFETRFLYMVFSCKNMP